jgi:hypothetical protein
MSLQEEVGFPEAPRSFRSRGSGARVGRARASPTFRRRRGRGDRTDPRTTQHAAIGPNADVVRVAETASIVPPSTAPEPRRLAGSADAGTGPAATQGDTRDGDTRERSVPVPDGRSATAVGPVPASVRCSGSCAHVPGHHAARPTEDNHPGDRGRHRTRLPW